MEITQQCVVALTWSLKDTLGEELDVLDEPVEFLVGGDDLLPRIEEALQGHGPGATVAEQPPRVQATNLALGGKPSMAAPSWNPPWVPSLPRP